MSIGFANGMVYQNEVSVGTAVRLNSLCDSATSFMLVQTSTATFDRGTCEDVLTNIINEFYQLDLSTPTPIPPVP